MNQIGPRLVLVEENDTPSDVAEWLRLNTVMPDMGIPDIQNTWPVTPVSGTYIILPVASKQQGIMLWPYPPREMIVESDDEE